MPPKIPAQDPEMLAINALTFLAEDPERLDRFLGMTGIDPSSLREAAQEPHFLGAVLAHLMSDEGLLLAFTAERQINPESIARARLRLDPPNPYA